MIKHTCSSCGAEYRAEYVKDWGKHAESNGCGPRPTCTALVPDHLGSGQMCRGQLMAERITPAEALELPTLHAN